MLGFRFSYLYRLHSESLMGLNAVCLPGGNPPGAVYRSSLPATPVSTPIRESSKFSEQALRDRLCRTPSPRKTFFFESRPSVPDIGLTGIGLNCLEQNWPLSPEEADKSFPPSICGDDRLNTNEETPSFSSDIVDMEDSESSLVESLKSKHDIKNKSNSILYVENLSYKVKISELKQLFGKFGQIKDVVVIDNHFSRKRLGHGYVKFQEESGLISALNSHSDDLKLNSRILRIFPATKKRINKFKLGYKNALEQKKPTVYKESEEEPLTISSLSNEVLAYIFNFLSISDRIRIERVCKGWQNVSLQMWKLERILDFNTMEHSIKNYFTTIKLQAFLKRCGENVQSINLNIGAAFLKLNYQALEIIGHYCPKLEEIDITGVPSTNTSLRILANTCPKLKKVVMANNKEISEKGIWWMLHSLSNLKHIDLSNNHRVTGQCFHLAGPTLTEVKLNNCNKLSLAGFTHLTTKCLNLTELHLDDCDMLSDRVLELLVQNLKFLKTLSLGGLLPNLTSTGLNRINNLNKLENLYLIHNSAVNDEVIAEFSHGCENLRCLNLSGCHNKISDAMFPFLQNFKYLTKLHLNYLPKITSVGLEVVAEIGILEQLEVRNCTAIDNSGVISILNHCPNLNLLDISSCPNISEDILLAAKSQTTKRRPRDPSLYIILGGCEMLDIMPFSFHVDSKLILINENRCEKHVCPDYFFSQEEEIEEMEVDEASIWTEEEDNEYVDLGGTYGHAPLNVYLESGSEREQIWDEELI